jgi:hypothetical protein
MRETAPGAIDAARAYLDTLGISLTDEEAVALVEAVLGAERPRADSAARRAAVDALEAVRAAAESGLRALDAAADAAPAPAAAPAKAAPAKATPAKVTPPAERRPAAHRGDPLAGAEPPDRFAAPRPIARRGGGDDHYRESPASPRVEPHDRPGRHGDEERRPVFKPRRGGR